MFECIGNMVVLLTVTTHVGPAVAMFLVAGAVKEAGAKAEAEAIKRKAETNFMVAIN